MTGTITSPGPVLASSVGAAVLWPEVVAVELGAVVVDGAAVCVGLLFVPVEGVEVPALVLAEGVVVLLFVLLDELLFEVSPFLDDLPVLVDCCVLRPVPVFDAVSLSRKNTSHARNQTMASTTTVAMIIRITRRSAAARSAVSSYIGQTTSYYVYNNTSFLPFVQNNGEVPDTS